MRQIREQYPNATESERAAFNAGVESVLYIRCYQHRATPMLNNTEAAIGECAQCAIESNQYLIAEEVNDILLLLYDTSIANAPMPPGDCRDIAEKVAAHVRHNPPIDRGELMTMTYLIPDAAALEAQISDLKDAWLKDIRAHQDMCPATFSNCVPHDCGCGLTELREAEMDKIEKLNSQPTEAKK